VTPVKLEFADCPAFFYAGFTAIDRTAQLPAWQTGWQLVSGQGLTEQSALASCLGEAAERMSLWTRGASDPLVSPQDPAIRELDAGDFLKLSDMQEAEIADHHRGLLRAGGGIDWNKISHRRVRCTNLAGETAEVASLCILLHEAEAFGIAGTPIIPISSTAGAAIWTDAETARGKALLELIERDAATNWWYNRLVPPRVDCADSFDSNLGQWLARRRRQTHFLKLPTEFPVDVIACLSCEPDGRLPALGLGADFDVGEASQAAALEMLKAEISYRYAAEQIGRSEQSDLGNVPSNYRWALSANAVEVPYLAGAPAPLNQSADNGSATEDAAALFAATKSLGIEVWFADLTRPEIGLPAAKAISPSLRDGLPHFAPRGYFVEKEMEKAGLNPTEFPI